MRLRLPDNQKPDDGNMLKRRLLGAAVLIAVAVITLPLLLDGAGSESRFRRVEQLRQEPPRIVDSQVKPGADTAAAPGADADQAMSVASAESRNSDATTTVQPAPAEVVATPVKPEKLPVPPVEPTQSAAAQPAAPPEPVPATEVAQVPVPAAARTADVVDQVAWVVQAGSYSAEENALALRARLREAGFPSFVSTGNNQGASVYRVKVGPLNNRQRAAKVQSDVESLLGQSTLIRKYP